MNSEKDRDEGRVSLEGLDPEAALRALMAVDPDSPPVDDDQDEPKSEPQGDE